MHEAHNLCLHQCPVHTVCKTTEVMGRLPGRSFPQRWRRGAHAGQDCHGRNLAVLQAVFHAERGLEWVVFAQQHQHAVVTALANWSCATVTVTFYATFLPILVCEPLPILSGAALCL